MTEHLKTTGNNCKRMLTVAALLLAVLTMILQTGCSAETKDASDASEPVSKQSFYFDTICQISIYGMDEAEADAAIEDAFSLCSEYEKLLSKTLEGSDVWKINHAGGEAVSCDARTIELIEKGISYGDLSGGRFDITIGPAEDLWDFHSDDPVVPDADSLAEAVSHVDYQRILVDEEQGTVQMSDPEAEIDLGGIAKGYIADAVCERLRADNVSSAIVSLGGNIECIGEKAEGTPFYVGVETPYSDRTEISGAAELTNGTLVTSGVYERYFTVNNKEYHHILSSESGYPVDTDVLGVTIRGSEGTSADCDALSTTCLMLGSEKGMRLIEQLDGYEAFFILRDGSTLQTEGMGVNEES